MVQEGPQHQGQGASRTQKQLDTKWGSQSLSAGVRKEGSVCV